MAEDSSKSTQVVVIGGGLAGAEAAWQLAQHGVQVTLYEMRPEKMTPAHTGGDLAELVCSNSLGSKLVDRATGLLQEELRRLGSVVLAAAAETQLPAGGALAVDREAFAAAVTSRIAQQPLISLVRREITSVPRDGIAVLATGPLTSDALAEDIRTLTGADALAFFDAMAPIVESESIDMTRAFRASRYDRGEAEEGDYINCPLTRDEYERFVQELLEAETIPLRQFEREQASFFEGCLPVEILARRNPEALRFGPMRPVGLRHPETGRTPYAVVQLRQDNAAASLYNLVGFQTNMTWPAQDRVLRLIPGLENARFVRYGQMHRNTFLCAPLLLDATLQFRTRPQLFAAGQLAGVEGYIGNAATGCLAGLNASRIARGLPAVAPPPETMLGAICRYLAEADAKGFQPMKANFGLLPPLTARPRGRRDRYRAYSERALACLDEWRKPLNAAGTSSPAEM